MDLNSDNSNFRSKGISSSEINSEGKDVELTKVDELDWIFECWGLCFLISLSRSSMGYAGCGSRF